jgi:hypothetical protein
MPKFLVWDPIDNFKELFGPLSVGWVEADEPKEAALDFATQWGHGFDEAYESEYIIHVLPEADARRIFADFPEDLMEKEALKIAKRFHGYTIWQVEERNNEED